MHWLKKIPWVSIVLLLLTYGYTGWMYGSWSNLIVERGYEVGWELEENVAYILVQALGALAIGGLAVAFTIPIAIVTVVAGVWLKSEVKAFLTIVFGALAFAITIIWFAYVTRLLILLSAVILVKLDLQRAGCDRWQTLSAIVILCLAGFTSGMVCFSIWGHIFV